MKLKGIIKKSVGDDVLEVIEKGTEAASEFFAKEIEDYNQWIPLNINDTDGDGYWIMYQDAITGDSINLNIV